MFKRKEVRLIDNPLCVKSVEGLKAEDFLYYDKDGFELNQAERKFYRAMNYPLTDCLNHICWQEPWFESTHEKLLLDHSLILVRASYQGHAAEQLKSLSNTIPQATLLLKTRQKWGFDFALDSIDETGAVFEVLHIEYDNYDYEKFSNKMIAFDYEVRHRDWLDAAERILLKRDKWEHLKGFEQNHWKAKFLLGWDLAEYTEKAV